MIDILSLFSVSHRMKAALTPGLPQELKTRSRHVCENHVSQLLHVSGKGSLITFPQVYVLRLR